MPENLKDLDNLKPIDHAVVAKPHTPVYKMHRYFARRPWSVFRSLIEHYSNPGSIVLDPFCGGGVTVVEGLRLGRKVIGVDINPMATFITFCEAASIGLNQFEEAITRLSPRVGSQLESLYLTTCRECGDKATILWTEFSKTYRCTQCGRIVKAYDCFQEKQRFLCPICQGDVPVGKGPHCGLLPLRLKYHCAHCKKSVEAVPTQADLEIVQWCEKRLSELPENVASYIPNDPLPCCNMERENSLHDKGIRRFRDMFTDRNLLSLALLRHSIATDTECDERTRMYMDFLFSATIDYATNMSRVVQGAGREITTHSFWPPETPCENNVWFCFQKRFGAIVKGKREVLQSLGAQRLEWRRHPETLNDFHHRGSASIILTQSSDSLPLEDQSIDVIITDPPYGSNVCYAELSNLWAIWIKDRLGIVDLIDNRKEAIIDRRGGFPCAKDDKHYRDMIYRIFCECYRVLRKNRWMVMTFHNKEFHVWNTLHLAAHDAGFRLAETDGMIYQPPIEAYTTTLHQKRGGSMLGDFILSFQKVGKQAGFREIEHAEIGRQIERLAAEVVLHHKGASLSLIYMKLMPWLLNNNLLDKISEKELVPYLTNSFEEKDGKWRLKASPGGELKQALEEYSRQHYKASYEDLDFVPVEARIEYLIKRLLYARGFATEDDILNIIYENLINSNMAEAREIQQVLSSIAQLIPISQAAAGNVSKGKAGRKVWKLKEDIEREKLFAELGADVQYRLATSEESDHDLAIARLVEMAGSRNLKTHIGRTEQMKYAEFRKMSSDLPQRVQGMPKAARDIIEQIDVIWHNGGRGIVAAFEVERTTTITSGIDRFRNLLTAAPESEVELYLVVPKSRGNEVRNKLGSPANRKDGLHKKIGYIYLEDLDIRHPDAAVDFEKIRRFINGGEE